MTPGQVRQDSLSALRATRREMISSAWNRKLGRQDLPTRRRAADTLLNIGAAIDTIENAKLESIRVAIQGDEAAIENSIGKLRRALDRAHTVTGLLDSVGELLAIGARIAPLLI